MAASRQHRIGFELASHWLRIGFVFIQANYQKNDLVA
jgi:hypothetical protein